MKAHICQLLFGLFIVLFHTSCVVYSDKSFHRTQEDIEADNKKNRFKGMGKRNYAIILNNGEKIKSSSLIDAKNDSIYYMYSYRPSASEKIHEERTVSVSEVKEIRFKDKALSTTLTTLGIVIPIGLVSVTALFLAVGMI